MTPSTHHQYERAQKIYQYTTITLSLLLLLSAGSLPFTVPFHPWTAALKITLYDSPVIIAISYMLFHKTAPHLRIASAYFAYKKQETNTSSRFTDTPPSVIFALLILTVITCTISASFAYNRYMDDSESRTITATITSTFYNNGKSSKHYFATIANPNPALLGFLPAQLLDISIRQEDVKKITPQRTEIRFPLFKGALGLPWTYAYTYQLQHMRDGFDARYDTVTTPTITSPHGIASEQIQAACRWTRDFDITKEIEPIAPDDHERNFWAGGEPRAVIPLVKGIKHGIEHDTFANGRVYADVPWKHGKKHGVFTLRRPNGTREQRLSYKNGELYGINTWFDDNGNSLQKALYLNNNTQLPAHYCK